MADRIKVAYLCHLVNDHISEKLPLKFDWLTKIAYFCKRKPLSSVLSEKAIWNTKALKEYELLTDEVELHVISPYPILSKRTYTFEENGIIYHFFRNDDDRPDRYLFNRLTKYKYLSYKRNRAKICELIKVIQPDIIHLIGAENPYYASAVLDVPKDTPILTQLQTLLNDPEFEKNYFMYKPWYDYRATMELEIFKRSDFLGTWADKFKQRIKNDLGLSVPILKTSLSLTEPMNLSENDKQYDFVYFAKNIAKAADWAIEAFILASQKHQDITLDIVGGYDRVYRAQLEKRLSAVGLQRQVTFEGELPTHDDVIIQIKKSRFAVLPIKVDLMTGTIRECMANGIPVVTTITPTTPKINIERENLLLSEKEDFQGMADNMCKLLESEEYAMMIRNNAALTTSQRFSNMEIVQRNVRAYRAILDNKRNCTPIPEELF